MGSSSARSHKISPKASSSKAIGTSVRSLNLRLEGRAPSQRSAAKKYNVVHFSGISDILCSTGWRYQQVSGQSQRSLLGLCSSKAIGTSVRSLNLRLEGRALSQRNAAKKYNVVHFSGSSDILCSTGWRYQQAPGQSQGHWV